MGAEKAKLDRSVEAVCFPGCGMTEAATLGSSSGWTSSTPPGEGLVMGLVAGGNSSNRNTTLEKKKQGKVRH
jgi:hypothetical protein